MAYTAHASDVNGTGIAQAPATCPECQDSYTWLAMYRDGRTLAECDGSGQHAGFRDIDLERLQRLVLLSRSGGAARVLDMQPGLIPIFFRRRFLEMNTENRTTIHCLGWRLDGVESFTFIFDDGSILVSNYRNAV